MSRKAAAYVRVLRSSLSLAWNPRWIRNRTDRLNNRHHIQWSFHRSHPMTICRVNTWKPSKPSGVSAAEGISAVRSAGFHSEPWLKWSHFHVRGVDRTPARCLSTGLLCQRLAPHAEAQGWKEWMLLLPLLVCHSKCIITRYAMRCHLTYERRVRLRLPTGVLRPGKVRISVVLVAALLQSCHAISTWRHGIYIPCT